MTVVSVFDLLLISSLKKLAKSFKKHLDKLQNKFKLKNYRVN